MIKDLKQVTGMPKQRSQALLLHRKLLTQMTKEQLLKMQIKHLILMEPLIHLQKYCYLTSRKQMEIKPLQKHLILKLNM